MLFSETNKSNKDFFLMAEPANHNQKYEQDTFDQAFLKVLHEVQALGFAKNLKKLEEHLKVP